VNTYSHERAPTHTHTHIHIYIYIYTLLLLVVVTLPVPVAARSKVLVYGRSPTAIVGSISTEGMDVCLLRVLSGRGICDELITRPEESYRLWRVVVCD
jgi:hypothetical protein